MVQTLLRLKKRSGSRETAWHGCGFGGRKGDYEQSLVSPPLCSWFYFPPPFMLLFSVNCHSKTARCPQAFCFPPLSREGLPSESLDCWSRGQTVWYPEGSVQSSEATGDPHPFGKSGSIWDSFAKDYTTGSLPLKDLPSSFIPWWFFLLWFHIL